MAVGEVTPNIKDGDGTTRLGRALSLTGALTGALAFLHGVIDSAGNLINPAKEDGNLASILAQLQGVTNVNAGGVSGVDATAFNVTASAYTSGQILGGKLTFANAVNSGPKSGVIQSVRVTSKAAVTVPLSIALFRDDPSASTWTDKTSPAINATDIPKLIGIYPLGAPYSLLGTHTIWTLDNIGAAIALVGTSVYGVLIPTAGFSPASTTDFAARLNVLKDN